MFAVVSLIIISAIGYTPGTTCNHMTIVSPITCQSFETMPTVSSSKVLRKGVELYRVVTHVARTSSSTKRKPAACTSMTSHRKAIKQEANTVLLLNVQIWRLPDLVLVNTLRGHKRGVWAAQFSPVDQAVATASGDKTLRLWALADGTCLKTFEGHTASVLRLSFLSAGTQVSCHLYIYSDVDECFILMLILACIVLGDFICIESGSFNMHE